MGACSSNSFFEMKGGNTCSDDAIVAEILFQLDDDFLDEHLQCEEANRLNEQVAEDLDGANFWCNLDPGMTLDRLAHIGERCSKQLGGGASRPSRVSRLAVCNWKSLQSSSH